MWYDFNLKLMKESLYSKKLKKLITKCFYSLKMYRSIEVTTVKKTVKNIGFYLNIEIYHKFVSKSIDKKRYFYLPICI